MGDDIVVGGKGTKHGVPNQAMWSILSMVGITGVGVGGQEIKFDASVDGSQWAQPRLRNF